ncbi:unnamed protein product, partial [marine sediment metagenome]
SLLTVINDILDYSKIEAGKLDVEIIDFDLRTTLDSLNDVLAIRAQQKGLEYICMVDPEVPTFLRGDPGRLRQVITNLVGNAVKFTSKGEIAVRVTLDEEDDDHATIHFAISDTGIGISADRIDTLFEAFTQADASVTRKFGGTGLGLSISKRLCEIMGGRMGVKSKAGKGSTFWFTAIFEKQAKSAQPASDVVEIDVASLEGTRILAVDDNATNRLLLEKQLRSWNFRHDEAQSGKAALAKLRKAVKEKDPFVIVILDMQMPGMDGE